MERGGFALHSLPTQAGGEEFYIRGHAEHITDAGLKSEIVAATDNHQGGQDFEALFGCHMQHILYTKWEGWGGSSPWPGYTKWPG